MPALIASCAVALTGAAVGLSLLGRLLGSGCWRLHLAARREGEARPLPAGRVLVAENLEVLPGDGGLVVLLAAFGCIQVVDDDVKCDSFVTRVGYLVSLRGAVVRSPSQPYHLLT